MKRVLKYILWIVISLVILFMLYGLDVTVCDRRLSRFYDVSIYGKLGTQSGEELISFSKVIKYEYLSSQYKSHISEENYAKINTVYEAKKFFDKIPIEVNITNMNDYRYINTENFKTPIGDSYVDRRERVIYHVVLGMERGWKPVIRRIKIIIEKF